METRTLVPATVVEDGSWKIEKYEDTMIAAIPDALVKEAQAYETLGMDRLARQSRLFASRATGTITGHQMSRQELEVWEFRYPSVFFKGDPLAGHRSRPMWFTGQRDFPCSRLSWPVPADVRKIIHDAQAVFPLIEIWTPEIDLTPRVGPSPILVGWLDGTAYLLARWAEALEPWEELVRRASTRKAKRMMRYRKQAIGDGGVSAVLFIAGLLCAIPTAIAMSWLTLFPLLGVIVGLMKSEAYAESALRRHAASMGWVIKE